MIRRSLAAALLGIAVTAASPAASARTCPLAVPGTGDAHPAALAGLYNGSQMEVGAQLELAVDGRFRYELAYGALDENAGGTWAFDGHDVVLTGDPVTVPRFAFLGEKPGKAGVLTVSLDLPAGISRQYFDARLLLADGKLIERQFDEDGLTIPLESGARPAAIWVSLPVYALASDRVPLSGVTGSQASFRFEPNDIGKVAFTGTKLSIEDCALRLDRFDLRLLFRKAEHQPE